MSSLYRKVIKHNKIVSEYVMSFKCYPVDLIKLDDIAEIMMIMLHRLGLQLEYMSFTYSSLNLARVYSL